MGRRLDLKLGSKREIKIDENYEWRVIVVLTTYTESCTSTAHGLELEIWEQIYCLSTALPLLMANEMSR